VELHTIIQWKKFPFYYHQVIDTLATGVFLSNGTLFSFIKVNLKK